MAGGIVSRKPLASALAAFRRTFTEVMTVAAQQVAGVVIQYAGDDDKISPKEAENITARAAQIIRRVFVDADGQALTPDGAPLSPYARLLMAACAYVTDAQALRQQRWMAANVPDDIQTWLVADVRPAKEFADQRKRTGAVLAFESLPVAENNAASPLYIFKKNPLREYDAPHVWVDPRGYVLSERIWRADNETRAKLNAYLRDQIANGNSATNIAKGVEQFLIPGRAALRTNKPYGRDASYDAMRLARTEIASANNRAAWAAAAMNPYVGGLDVYRSGAGDPSCPVCPQYVTFDMSGARVRPPYSISTAITPPYHPHCMCYYVAGVVDDPETVARRIRQAMIDSSNQTNPTRPAMTPLSGQPFTLSLLGQGFVMILQEMAAILGLPSLR